MDEAERNYEQRHYSDVIRLLLPHCQRKNAVPGMLELLARAYANQGNAAEALAWCDRAIAIEKINPRLHYLHAMILQERGDFAQASRSFRRTIYLDSEFVMAHIGVAQLALGLGNRKEAENHFAQVHRLLSRYAPHQLVPEADGLDAEHLGELIAGGLDKGRGI